MVASLERSKCSICLEDIESLSSSRVLHVKEGGGHRFHRNCINEWLARESSCPLCKRIVTDLPLSPAKVKGIAAIVSYIPTLVLPYQNTLVSFCRDQNIEGIRRFLRSRECDVNVTSLCLLIASINQSGSVLLELLKSETYIEYRSQALVEVVKKNNLELAQLLLSSGVTDYGWSKSLFIAAENNHLSLIGALKEYGQSRADFKAFALVDYNYHLPVTGLFFYLLDDRINPEKLGEALNKAAGFRNFAVAELLITRGAKLNNSQRAEVAMLLMIGNKLDLAARILEEGPIPSESAGIILIYTCRKMRLDILNSLLSSNTFGQNDRSKALIEVAEPENLRSDPEIAHEMISALLKGGELNQPEKLYTLSNLCLCGLENTFELLASHVDLTEVFMSNLLMLSARLGHSQIGLALLSKGEVKASLRKKAIVRAINSGQPEFAKALFEGFDHQFMFRITAYLVDYIYRYGQKSWHERLELAFLQSILSIFFVTIFLHVAQSNLYKTNN